MGTKRAQSRISRRSPGSRRLTEARSGRTIPRCLRLEAHRRSAGRPRHLARHSSGIPHARAQSPAGSPLGRSSQRLRGAQLSLSDSVWRSWGPAEGQSVRIDRGRRPMSGPITLERQLLGESSDRLVHKPEIEVNPSADGPTAATQYDARICSKPVIPSGRRLPLGGCLAMIAGPLRT